MGIDQWASHGMPMGPLIGGFNGMALWVAHGDQPMAFLGIGTSHGVHGMVLWVAHGDPQWCSISSAWGSHPIAIPWNGIVTAHGGIPRNGFMGSAWG